MYKGFMIHSSDFKHQPMDTKKDKDTENDREKTEINSTDFQIIRKLVQETDKTMHKN